MALPSRLGTEVAISLSKYPAGGVGGAKPPTLSESARPLGRAPLCDCLRDGAEGALEGDQGPVEDVLRVERPKGRILNWGS